MHIRHLIRAEARRAFRKGGLLPWLTASTILAWLAGGLIIYLATFMADEVFDEFGHAEVIGAAAAPPLLLITVATSNYVTRDIDSGMFTLNKLLIGSRPAIMTARLATWSAMCLLMQLLAILPPLLIATMINIKGMSLGAAAMTVLVTILVNTLLVVLVYALAMIVRKGAYVMIVSLMLLIGIPLLLSMAALTLPTLSEVLTEISTWSPGTAAMRATSIPGIDQDAQAHYFIHGWVTLLAWLIGGTFTAYTLFRRDSFDFRD